MATPCFYLNVTIRGYDAEVFLNGAPILSAVRAYSCIALPPVSEWVVQGENVLSVVIHGGDHIDPPEEPDPAEVSPDAAEGGAEASPAAGSEGAGPPEAEPPEEGDDDQEPPLLRVAFCRGEIGELVEPGQENELAVLEWEPPPPPAEDEEPLTLPHEASEAFDASHPWGTWRWEAAPAFDLEREPEAVVEVAQFLADLHAAVAQGQLNPLLDASQIKTDEVGPCYDMDPADARARLVNAWPEITKPAGWALAPFDESNLELRPCCAGRILEPRTLAGEPILRQAERLEGTRWMMPLYVARVDGQLCIVR